MEKITTETRKRNMKTYTIHKMLTADLLFYYAVKFLFLTKAKGLTASDIVIASSFLGLFKVIFQIPTTAIIEKFGHKKSLMFADIFQALSTICIMMSNSLPILIIANMIGAMGNAVKEVSEAGLLNLSIPASENKGKIYSSIEGKGLGNYYYFSAVSAIISGLLFELNPYIPMIICTTISFIAARVTTNFTDIQKPREITNKTSNTSMFAKYKKYFKDLKLAFSFIFTSKRLKSLMIYSAIMYGMIMVMGTYEMGLLSEVGMSATATGLIYAIMQVVAGIASKKQESFHNKFRKRSLTIIGVTYTTAILIAGLISATILPQLCVVTILILTYSIRYADTGFYYVLIKKYITNFTNEEVANKVYSANGLVTGIGNALICALGSVIVAHNSIINSMIIFGILFFVIMILVLTYMKNRVGLMPNEYEKKDIDYRAYIDLE